MVQSFSTFAFHNRLKWGLSEWVCVGYIFAWGLITNSEMTTCKCKLSWPCQRYELGCIKVNNLCRGSNALLGQRDIFKCRSPNQLSPGPFRWFHLHIRRVLLQIIFMCILVSLFFWKHVATLEFRFPIMAKLKNPNNSYSRNVSWLIAIGIETVTVK